MAAKNGSAAALLRLLKQELLRYKIAQMLLYCAAAFHAQVVARNNDRRALPAVVCALARAPRAAQNRLSISRQLFGSFCPREEMNFQRRLWR